MIYYGDEVGMWGANDPCCRKPMIWDDLEYEDELYLPDQSTRNSGDNVAVNRELFDFYKKLIHIRNQHQALQLGDFKTLQIENAKKCYIFSRDYKNQTIIVALNNDTKSQNILILLPGEGVFVDVLNSAGLYKSINKTIQLNIPYKWGCILKREE